MCASGESGIWDRGGRSDGHGKIRGCDHDRGGLPEVVAQGETGLLIPPGDVESLAATVVSLLQDDSRREQMGRCGRTRAQERFSLDASVMHMEELYDELLAVQKGRG